MLSAGEGFAFAENGSFIHRILPDWAMDKQSTDGGIEHSVSRSVTGSFH